MVPDDLPTAQARRRLLGRLAGVFFVGSAFLAIATLPLAPSDVHAVGTLVVAGVAIVLGFTAWSAPWDRLPPRSSLVIVPPGFALIALGNLFGGADAHTYGVFFVVAFVWIGVAHPPGTSLLMSPLAAVAYVLPLYHLPGSVSTGLNAATLTIPACVLVGESLAWGTRRLVTTEQALHLEREVAEGFRQLDELKNRFMSTISHELRTPITIVRGHLEVLHDATAPAEVRDTVDMVVDELARMGRLVDDVDALARMEGNDFLRPERLQLERFLADLASKAEPLLDGRLRVASVPNDARLSADPQRLTQALLNLLRNAAVHTQGGPVELRVRAEPRAWRFEVADSGGGVAIADERSLFEPFRRGGSRASGTGLGLAIVRGIATAHGGTAGLDNRPGRGATFWIRIPR
jgi:signal transduction histidine kinase